MNDVQANPQVVEVIEEIEEDLTPFIEALAELQRPATAREIAKDMVGQGLTMSPESVRRRLDRLATDEGSVNESLLVEARTRVAVRVARRPATSQCVGVGLLEGDESERLRARSLPLNL